MLLLTSVKHLAPPNREVSALVPHSSVVSPIAEVHPLPEPNANTSVANALRLLSSVVLLLALLAVLTSKVNAAVLLLLLACVPPLSAQVDLAVPRVLKDVMPHPVPPMPKCHSIDVEHPLVLSEDMPHKGL